ncbi:MAG: uncharacterized protein QG577_1837, partial [Thermodesulfobacteriota bacterium]|nr:uncharacterized protein [Thermodesulfobacteriota bacterium]
MKIFLAGGTGFVGKNLTRFLVNQGHQVTTMARHPKPAPKSGMAQNVSFVAGDGTRPGPWQDVIPQHDVVINLAGVTVFKRWNDEYKKLLRDSRILTTRHIVDAIPQEPSAPVTL